jgi:hypothetical protein
LDDILIISDVANTMAASILQDRNATLQLKYTMETETNQLISILDLNILRKVNEFTLGMYRKPTYTDKVTPISSNHPNKCKQAIFNNLLDTAYKTPINKDGSNEEI